MQYRGLIIFIEIITSLFALVQVWHRKAGPEEKKQELERQHEGIGHLMNVLLPKMPDDSIHLEHITYRDGVLHTPYTLTQVTKSEIDVDAFFVEKKEPIVTSSCGDKGLGTFIKSGLVINYSFNDSSNSSITEFKVGPSNCK